VAHSVLPPTSAQFRETYASKKAERAIRQLPPNTSHPCRWSGSDPHSVSDDSSRPRHPRPDGNAQPSITRSGSNTQQRPPRPPGTIAWGCPSHSTCVLVLPAASLAHRYLVVLEKLERCLTDCVRTYRTIFRTNVDNCRIHGNECRLSEVHSSPEHSPPASEKLMEEYPTRAAGVEAIA